MKGSYQNSFDFAVCLTKESLEEVNEFLNSQYNRVTYFFSTIDKIDFQCETHEDILHYKNSNQNKIIKMKIRASHKKDCYLDDFVLTIRQKDLPISTIQYEIRNESEKDLFFLKTKLDELCKGLKSSNSWMYSFWFMFLCLIPVSIVATTFLNKNLSNVVVDKRIFLVISIMISGSLGILFARFWSNIINFIFPTSYFCFGEQSKQNQITQSIKSFVLTVITGLITSLIIWFITK